MVVLQKADTNLDEVVNDVNNLVNCIHCHGPFLLSFSEIPGHVAAEQVFILGYLNTSQLNRSSLWDTWTRRNLNRFSF